MSGKGFEFVSYSDYGEKMDYTIIHSYVVFEGIEHLHALNKEKEIYIQLKVLKVI